MCRVHAWLLALALCAAASAAGAELRISPATSRYPLASVLLYLEDPTRALTVDDVAKPGAPFRRAAPSTGDINFGYSRSAYWLALPYRVATGAPSRWLLEVAYSSLDHVEVYVPRDGGYVRQVAGDLQPFRDRPYPHRNLVFPLELDAGKIGTVYLRVTSQGNLTFPATLWTPAALHAEDEKDYALLSIYYGMLLALLLYNVLLFLSVRDGVFLWYSLFVTAMAIAMVSLNGFGNQFLWPEHPGWGNVALPVGMCGVGFFGALFTRRFLETRARFPRIDRVLLAFVVYFAVGILSAAVLEYRYIGMWTSIGGLAFAASAVAIGLYCHTRGHPGARYFLLAWTLLAIGAAGLAMRNFGWLPTTVLTTYSMQIGSSLELLLLSFALADRINVMRRQKEAASQDALEAKQAMVDALTRSERELELRVNERTHALAEANALLTAKEQALQHIAHHDALTGLANRTLFADRIQQAIARVRRSGMKLAVLVVDVDEFKRVNDTHGHPVGDQLLREIGRALTACVREADTVARLGGDEFVVVLEDIRDVTTATQIADKVVSAAREPIALTVGAVGVSVSVGVACYPEHGADVDALMRHADAAMYAVKSAGRNGWRSAAA